ncbi:MAG: hypothetical protein GY722_28810 [bacterium]|nr:hypothetical protein [bacterium]
MRGTMLILGAVLLASGCGGGSPSVNDYVEALNAMNDEFSPRGEANYVKFMGHPEPTLDDLRALLNANVDLRLEIQDALEALDAPEQIEDLNASWVAWHARFLAAAEAQSVLAVSVGSWDEFLDSAELAAWWETVRDGAALCADIEGRLNSTEAAELFSGTAWMPSELTDVVHAVIGCESFPDDLDDLAAIYGR